MNMKMINIPWQHVLFGILTPLRVVRSSNLGGIEGVRSQVRTCIL
jgi:hypothetical protein